MARKPTYEELEQRITVLEKDFDMREQAEAKIKNLNAELISNEARHRSLLKSMPDPVAVYDMERRADYINPAFSQTFGWSLDEFCGKRIEFVPDQRAGEILERGCNGFIQKPFKMGHLSRMMREILDDERRINKND